MTLSVQKLSASLQSVCLCWTNRLCVASFGLVNGRNTCGLQKSYLLSCSLATIRSPFDSHTEKETVSPAFPPHPLASLLSLFLSFFFFVFFFTGQALELGRDTRLVVSMAWIMLVLLLDQAVYWCVWHSKWEISSSLARLRAKSLHFLFLTGSRIWELPKECHFFFFVQPVSETLCFELANIAFGAETGHSTGRGTRQASSPIPRWARPKAPKFQEGTTALWALTPLGGWAWVFNPAPSPRGMSCVVPLLNPLCVRQTHNTEIVPFV